MHKPTSFKHQGFTLIELVLVIVILGVLAATAAPKFLDLSADAKKANMQALAGAMASAADLVFYKSKIPGYLNKDGDKVELDVGTIRVKGDGYPEARYSGGIDIVELIDFDDDWLVCYSDNNPPCTESSSSRVKIGYDPTGDPEPGKDTDMEKGCYVRYTEPTGTHYESSQKYTIEVFTNGC